MRIPPNISEWLNLAARWFHVFAGILWVGTTFYFTWLDGRFTEAGKSADNAPEGAEVWMVHSGGFYVVEKRTSPGPHELHWFRWEAGLTWLSGMVLLILVYYLGGAMVDEDVRDISPLTATLFGIGLLVAAWIIYDVLVQSPFGGNEKAFAVAAFVLVVGASYGVTHVLSGRAAYIHIGAMFGTIMAANVWMRILPAQRRMIAATRAGQTPDGNLAARAKLRSKHNTFMAVPVVFTMISNHYPVSTFGHNYNWIILSAMVLVGWGAAKLIRRA